MRVLAPASSANLGAGFDCAAVALELWNELEVEELGPQTDSNCVVEIHGEGAGELPQGDDHLALRAFARFADPARYRFRFVNRIPLERGLGSSAAAIAAGLVAGAACAGREISGDELLQEAVRLDGHADNVAAALLGGVTVAWHASSNGSAAGFHARRLADGLPLVPVLALPSERTNTTSSRGRLPAEIAHGEAVASAGAATLLGAALASGDAELLRASFDDRLHEPFRAADAPLLQALRGDYAVTLSGSGPSVVVWTEEAARDATAADLARRLPPDTTVLPLAVARRGAHVA
jgi:homoserine kinase